MAKTYRVLYWIKDQVPTLEEQIDREQYGPHSTFRTVMYHDPDAASLEECDACAGLVPEAYKVFPAAVPIAEWYREQRAAETARTAPQMPVQPRAVHRDPVTAPPDPFLAASGTATVAGGKQIQWNRNA